MNEDEILLSLNPEYKPCRACSKLIHEIICGDKFIHDNCIICNFSREVVITMLLNDIKIIRLEEVYGGIYNITKDGDVIKKKLNEKRITSVSCKEFRQQNKILYNLCNEKLRNHFQCSVCSCLIDYKKHYDFVYLCKSVHPTINGYEQQFSTKTCCFCSILPFVRSSLIHFFRNYCTIHSKRKYESKYTHEYRLSYVTDFHIYFSLIYEMFPRIFYVVKINGEYYKDPEKDKWLNISELCNPSTCLPLSFSVFNENDDRVHHVVIGEESVSESG